MEATTNSQEAGGVVGVVDVAVVKNNSLKASFIKSVQVTQMI